MPSHGSSSSASGTRVVLPAPGGATSTADVRACEGGAQVADDGVDGEGCVMHVGWVSAARDGEASVRTLIRA